jgi:Uma2 family endonuclease
MPTAPAKVRMTAQEYAQLPPTNAPMELIEGEPVLMPSPYEQHQAIVLALLWAIQRVMPQGKLRFAPLDVHLDEHNVVQPDIFWVSDDNTTCSTDGKFWYGAPDLVVEVLSEGSIKRDKIDKFALYQARGVREYWIAEPRAGYLEVWTHKGGAFAFVGAYDERNGFTSPVLGKAIDLKPVFLPTPPTETQA